MKAPWTKLEAAENDLERLMTEVTRAMEKAQEAVEKITCKPGGAHPDRIRE